VVGFSEYYILHHSSKWFPGRNELAQTRFNVSTLAGIVEFIPAAHFLSRIVSRRSNGDYEYYLAWGLGHCINRGMVLPGQASRERAGYTEYGYRAEESQGADTFDRS
jgi:hypothetical protein